MDNAIFFITLMSSTITVIDLDRVPIVKMRVEWLVSWKKRQRELLLNRPISWTSEISVWSTNCVIQNFHLSFSNNPPKAENIVYPPPWK